MDSGLQIGGEANLTAAIQVTHLVLKNRKNRQLQQRIIVFVSRYDLRLHQCCFIDHTLHSSSKFVPCSPAIDEKNLLEDIGKKLKKNNVALDVVDFGESNDEKHEKLEALVAAVNSGGNSHIIHIPAGHVLSDDIFR